MPEDPYIVFGRPTLGDAEIAAITRTLQSGWVGTGPQVHAFEAAFAEELGCAHAVAVSSCTAALHLSLIALGLQPGDEVITTPLTFAATANAIVHAGATPVFADVDPATGNLDPLAVEKAIGPRTRALLPVHMYGRPCDLTVLSELARQHQLALIEDAAHAIETEWQGKRCGHFGDAACFSFYVTKNITTVEGGMLLTNRAELAEKARVLALHGLSADAWARFSDNGYRHYDVVYSGFKYNMTDMQASLGLVQLQRLHEWHERRSRIWRHYDAAFSALAVKRPASEQANTRHARHLYTLELDPERSPLARDPFLLAMHAQRIGTGVHYRALHSQPFYRDRYGLQAGDFPNAQRIGERTVSLPLTASLTDAEVERITSTVCRLLSS